MHSVRLSGGDKIRIRGISSIMFLTHRAEASIIHMHGLYIAKDLNPTSIQKEP